MKPGQGTRLRFLKPHGKLVHDVVKAKDPDLVHRIGPRLDSATSPRTFRRHWIDIEFAFEWLQKDIPYVHEPRLNARKHMEWCTGFPNDHKADFGIRPNGRDICFEIKTLEPADYRGGAAEGPFAEEFHRRANETLSQYPRVPGARLRMAPHISNHKGELSSAVKAADNALKQAAATGELVEDLPVIYNGQCIGYLTIDGSPGISTIHHGHGASSTDALKLLKNAQTARNCPSVVVLHTAGEVTPTPFELADKIAGIWRTTSAFDARDARHTSAVLLYPQNDDRQLLVNPNAERPLQDVEREILEAPFQWPLLPS